MEHTMGTPAPALARGIRILRLLEDGQRYSLDALARRTGIPKASLMRLLQALIELELVERSPDSKAYAARARIVPLAAGEASFGRAVAQSLQQLASQSEQTAEWYVPNETGMVLVRRREPEAQQVHVVARIGFVRPCQGELDAVACLAAAFYHSPASYRGFWTYDHNGAQRRLNAGEARKRIEEAGATRWARDAHYNTNGVRRIAAAVTANERLIGILALAGSYQPGRREYLESQRPLLTKTARTLPQTYQRSDI